MIINDFVQKYIGKKMYIFGAGVRGKECLHMLKVMNAPICSFFDNAQEKQGTILDDYRINKPALLKDAIVIVTVKGLYSEIENQLLDMGYGKQQILTYEEILYQYMKFDEAFRKQKEKNSEICKYPKVIQLPITFLCNFDCIMCGMNHMSGRKEINHLQLKEVLENELFQEVEAVGVNGGEPFLKKDIRECFEVMLETLPHLKVFNIISNGYFTENILETLEDIKKSCKKKQVKLNLSLSIDGINDLQDYHRGKTGAYKQLNATVDAIMREKNKYVDTLSGICTVTRHNIERINEVLAWEKEKQIEVLYNIATVNERIENQDRLSDFSVLEDSYARMLAKEFFYCLYNERKIEKYFALFLYLSDGKRYADCPCRHNEWITLTPDGQLAFCATHSKMLGSCLDKTAYELMSENISYLNEITTTCCETCSHYIYELNFDGLLRLHEEQNKNRGWI